jgi:hypothetical protein
MARVFLADSDNFVEVPDASVTLADICAAFGVDATAAYIRRSHSGAVVATLPSEGLPEFSGNCEYVLCAASAAAASTGGAGGGGGATRRGDHRRGFEDEVSDGDDAEADARQLQHARLRMAHLIDAISSGGETDAAVGGAAALAMPLDEREALAAFLERPDDAMLAQDAAAGAGASSAAGSARHGAAASGSGLSDIAQSRTAMLVAGDDLYNALALGRLLRSLPRKNVNANRQYAFL